LRDGYLYSAKVSQENQDALWGQLGSRMGRLKVVCLKMKQRVCLGLADVKRLRGPYFGYSDMKSASATVNHAQLIDASCCAHWTHWRPQHYDGGCVVV